MPEHLSVPWGKPVVTGRAALVVGAAALLLLAWPGPVGSGCIALGALVLLALMADLVLSPRPGHIATTRQFPGTLSLGGQAEASWQLTNTSRRPTTVGVAEELAPSLNASARRARLHLAAGQTLKASVTLRPSRRGHFMPTELVVRTLGPLGLMGRQSARSQPTEIRVFPNFGSRRQAELLVERARILEVGLRSARVRGGATDFEQLREYGIDDDARRIDWAATARADRPIVRTYRAERNQRVICLFDNGRAMAGQVQGVARAEHAIDAIMMLTSVAGRAGDMPGLVAFDTHTRAVVPPRSGQVQLTRVTEALYDLQPVLAQSDYRRAFSEVLARFQRRALLCLVTELDEAMVGTLLPSLGLIARTHLLVVGAVRDPAVARWAAEPPTEVEGVYRGAAAVMALSRRQELARMLAARGAIVVDELPATFPARLTDAYLQAKASGRL